MYVVGHVDEWDPCSQGGYTETWESVNGKYAVEGNHESRSLQQVKGEMKENTFKDQLEYCNTMNDMEYLPVNPQVKNGM